MFIEPLKKNAKDKKEPVVKTGTKFIQFKAAQTARTKRRLRSQINVLPINASKRLLLFVLSSFYSSDQSADNIFPSTSWLAESSGLSQRYVRKCLRDLEIEGWLIIQDTYARYKGKKKLNLTSSRYYFPDTIFLYNPYSDKQSEEFIESLSRIQAMKPRSTILMGKGSKNYLSIKDEARESLQVQTAAFRSHPSSTKTLNVSPVPVVTHGLVSQEEEIKNNIYKSSSISKKLTEESYEVAIDLDDFFDEFDKVHKIESPREDRLRFSRNFCVKGFYENRTEFYKILRVTLDTIKKNPLLKSVAGQHTRHTLGRLFSAQEIFKADFGQKCEARKVMSKITGQKLEVAMEIFANRFGIPEEDVKRWFDYKEPVQVQSIREVAPSFIVSEPPSHFYNVQKKDLYEHLHLN